jgi:hypothetical protein
MLFALVNRVFTDLHTASESDLCELKNLLRSYDVVDESSAPLSICNPPLVVASTHVTFGVNTSGMAGADFYLTIKADNSVLYNDGMGENYIPISSTYSES